MTNEQLTELAAQARRAWRIAAEHPEEAAGLLDRVADCLEHAAEWGYADVTIEFLRNRLDSLELTLGVGING